MFGFLKRHLQKIYTQFTSKIHSLFSREKIDEQTLQELESILIGADTGVKTTNTIISSLKTAWKNGTLQKGTDLKLHLEKILTDLLEKQKPLVSTPIYILVGINGSGKTTFASKLAHQYKQAGKKVLLVAADTFRAAAVQQLETWAQKTGTTVVTGKDGQDPASVVFTGCQMYKDGGYDTLIIDTAGRLQTKTNLMKELEKIKKTVAKQLPDYTITTLLTVDAMLGQNSFEQAKLFNESTKLDGIVLTKMDGTGKGGIVFSVVQELSIPVAYISFGEQVDDCKPFDPTDYVQNLLNQ